MTAKLEQLLQSVDERPTTAAYAHAARQVRSLDDQLRRVRAALLATFTIDSLVPYLEVEAARGGFAADVYLGPFNAITQELLNPGSGCLSHCPDVIFVAQLLSDVCPPLVSDFLALDNAQVDKHIERTVSDFVETLTAFRQLSQAAIVVHNFTLPHYPLLGIHEATAQGSQTEAIRRLNTLLAEEVKSVPGVYVLDFDRMCADLGYRNWHNDKMWYLGRAPLSASALPLLAQVQAAFMQAILGSPRKCLVLDLDNTLWGGVIGEVGLSGIQLGHNYPGNAFRQFQQDVLQLYRRGVLLAINSKNNPTDVEEVFNSHPDMVLKREHFTSIHVNWRSKPDNMMEIANDLNIGLDSLVFFDDNPAERAMMRQALPQVLTLEVPPDPMKYSQALLEGRAFDRLSFTDEDRRRGEMYRDRMARRQLEQSTTSVEDFLRSLQMAITIWPVDEFAFPRIVDLIHKTNQFNLTTQRHSTSRLTEMIADPAYGVFSLRLTDRFGDNGIVGAAIVQIQDIAARIDTLLLSCRVIGRTAETAFLAFLVDWAKKHGATLLEGEFVPTAKNAPAADFYSQHGFTRVDSGGGAPSNLGSRWQLRLDDVPFEWPDYIRSANAINKE